MGACGCVDTEEIASGFQCNRDSASGADWTAPPSNGSNNGYGGRQNAPVRDAGEQDATADASVCDSGADADADADASSSCTERSPAPTSDVDASDARP
jgi:hypothetical protein